MQVWTDVDVNASMPPAVVSLDTSKNAPLAPASNKMNTRDNSKFCTSRWLVETQEREEQNYVERSHFHVMSQTYLAYGGIVTTFATLVILGWVYLTSTKM